LRIACDPSLACGRSLAGAARQAGKTQFGRDVLVIDAQQSARSFAGIWKEHDRIVVGTETARLPSRGVRIQPIQRAQIARMPAGIIAPQRIAPGEQRRTFEFGRQQQVVTTRRRDTDKIDTRRR